MSSDELVRIIRFANEGFNISKQFEYPGFYDIEVSDYTNNQKIIRDEPSITNQEYGCYCHFYKFNMTDLGDSGSLSMRKGHAMNIGYLPFDYPVFVRNMRPDKSRIVRSYVKLKNPEDKSIHKFEEKFYFETVRMG